MFHIYKPLLCIGFVNFGCIYWGHSIYDTVMVLGGLERHVQYSNSVTQFPYDLLMTLFINFSIGLS